jgi:hypothetical protein
VFRLPDDPAEDSTGPAAEVVTDALRAAKEKTTDRHHLPTTDRTCSPTRMQERGDVAGGLTDLARGLRECRELGVQLLALDLQRLGNLDVHGIPPG